MKENKTHFDLENPQRAYHIYSKSQKELHFSKTFILILADGHI